MSSDPDNKKYFSVDTANIISEILQKYSLDQTDEELAEKIFGENDEPFIINGGVVLQAAINLAERRITEKDAVLDLQNKLKISEDIAKKIVEEVKINLINPSVNKNIHGQYSATEEKSDKIMPPPSKQNMPKIKKREIKKISEKETKVKQNSSDKSAFDVYREPIE